VITHVHSDHVAGLLTAQQYAIQAGSFISTEMLVSNHGEHDLDLIIKESNISSLLDALRNQKRIVAMTDDAINNLSLNDPNMEIEGIILPSAASKERENKSGLILKVTEIRDGKRRAILFLGDIERTQQKDLILIRIQFFCRFI